MFILTNNLVAMIDSDNAKAKIIAQNRVEFLRIINPGLQSTVARSEVKPKVLMGYKERLNTVGISRDSKYIVTTSDEKKAVIWDISDPNNIKSVELIGHNHYVISAEISKCGRYVVTCSWDHTARVWDISDWKNIKSVELKKHTAHVETVKISNCGKYVITGSDDCTARVWDISDWNNIKSLELNGHTRSIKALIISRCGQYVVTGSHDDTARVWNISDWNNIKSIELKGHENLVKSLAISRCGKYVVTGSCDNTARVWDISDWSNIKFILLKGHKEWVNAVAISRCGKYVITGSQDDSARLWLINDWNKIESYELKGHTSLIIAVEISRCGKYIVTGSYDGNVIVWDISDFENIKLVQLQDTVNNISRTSKKDHVEKCITTLSLSRCGKYIATGSYDTTVKLWNISSWAIDYMDLNQLQILEKLVSVFEARSVQENATPDTQPNIENVINYYKQIRDNFTEIVQHYIERYLRNKFVEYYLTRSSETSGTDLKELINSYLELGTSTKTSNGQVKAYRPVNLSKTLVNKNCANCNKSDSTLRCSKCRQIYYCSKDCQKTHWAKHKLVCK